MRGHRRGAAAKQTVRRRRKESTFSSLTRHKRPTVYDPSVLLSASAT